ncbi:nucleotidyltransferase family protein [Shewanella sp. 0m-4]
MTIKIDVETQIKLWLLEDEYRLNALLIAEQLKLNDWMLAAGFVRNLVWDKLHSLHSPLNDIDLIYFDPSDLSVDKDTAIEAELSRIAPMYPWSVKNQARMHLRNQHKGYTSSLDAMSYWPEKQTAVGVSCQLTSNPLSLLVSTSISAAKSTASTHSLGQAEISLHSPFEPEYLFDLSLQHNPKAKRALFEQRVKNKRWLQTYPKLRDNG